MISMVFATGNLYKFSLLIYLLLQLSETRYVFDEGSKGEVIGHYFFTLEDICMGTSNCG
jgi:hypothetical protein